MYRSGMSCLVIGGPHCHALVGLYSVQRGDARVIVYPMDYDGNICGLLDFGGRDMTDYTTLTPIREESVFKSAPTCMDLWKTT